MSSCVFCHRDVDPDARSTARQVNGWELRRYGGGANVIWLRIPSGQFAHGECVKREADLRKRNIPSGQQELL